ncbi:serine/threonine-protein kinase/endoribonuclease IRE1 [Nylanderia fulva]|uniref:serine/threonine-protein kinase/endoribonuclease IRE1 n=1 Tax=Nylanderia fulva TaxID=613905 RepID=UPI0010FAF32C|nr:serine/threonine-protein kinase/endoribonuclease IRE1 [Nylanderia fulva]XP_029178142.1 serine/threonine-protein kinase/endoribonuclease IRE1 [Nylanderia fulva]
MFFMMMNIWLLLSLSMFAFIVGQPNLDSPNTELVAEQNDTLLVFFTLEGSFVGVSQQSGEIRWKHHDEPVVKVPLNLSEPEMPIFLPDPRDGSLYLFGRGTEELKKLPFTIPELVANSPCRSSDGILYTGRKIDTWFSIDPRTGMRESLSFNNVGNTCPSQMQNAIFVGRTEYNIIMVDSKHKDRKWNVITFNGYSAAEMEPDVTDNYDLLHITGSSTGCVVTLDKRWKILWELNLKSPVIAMYTVTKDGLVRIPFTSVADSFLERFTMEPSNDYPLFPTVFVGKHQHGPYALPSFADSSTTISNNIERSLLEGSSLTSSDLHADDNKLPGNYILYINEDNFDNYQNAKHIRKNLLEFRSQKQLLQITGRSDPIILESSTLNVTERESSVAEQSDVSNDTGQLESNKNWHIMILNMCKKVWTSQQENNAIILLLTVLVICVITIWYTRNKKQSQQLLQNSRESSRTSHSGRSGDSVVLPEDIGDDLVKVGKIIFNTKQILGKGCEGTSVFKGEFDGRAVAVKRLLPDCFTFADREVALLRESDAHENVVRYFCTEEDRMFRYIALELAEATLQDYVTGRYDREKISVKNILYQATSGLAHLHLLDIVHRDIKPHNVLLSVPGPRGEVRAMISDFGLCKKLQLGRVSFSRRSGITGTDGWIAPEMLNGERTTCAVDIFSLGCVFYYVLSDGKHPFGDPLRRQANILCGETNMTALQGISSSDRELALLLIKMMICRNPAERPPALSICNYPIFWNPGEILSFFQDVSDRVEKDQLDSPALISLETCSKHVIRDDWRSHIDHEVAADLRKYRSYRGDSVRDLLRALRNKKHHYRELTPEAQRSLGEIPEKFTEYWLTRFPCLLCHVWCAMQSFRDESTLKQYYHSQYIFPSDYEEQELSQSVPIHLMQYSNVLSTSTKMQPITDKVVNWSPNRVKNRGQRRKERRKQEEDPLWILQSPNEIIQK